MKRRLATFLLLGTLPCLSGCLGRQSATDAGEGSIVVGTNRYIVPLCQRMGTANDDSEAVKCALVDRTPEGDKPLSKLPDGVQKVQWSDPKSLSGADVIITSLIESEDGLTLAFRVALSAPVLTKVEVMAELTWRGGSKTRNADVFTLPYSIRTYGRLPVEAGKFQLPGTSEPWGFQSIQRSLSNTNIDFNISQASAICEMRGRIYIAGRYVVYRAVKKAEEYEYSLFAGNYLGKYPTDPSQPSLQKIFLGEKPAIYCREGSTPDLDRVGILYQSFYANSLNSRAITLYWVEASTDGEITIRKSFPTAISRLSAVALDKSSLYALDVPLARPSLLKIDLASQTLSSVPIRGVSPLEESLIGQDYPMQGWKNFRSGGIAAASGEVYVALTAASSLFKVSPTGAATLAVGTPLDAPVGITSLGDGSLVLANYMGAKNLIRWDPKTGLATHFLGSSSGLVPAVGASLPASSQFGFRLTTTSSTVPLTPISLSFSSASKKLLLGVRGYPSFLGKGHILEVSTTDSGAPDRVRTLAGGLIRTYANGDLLFPSGAQDEQSSNLPDLVTISAAHVDSRGRIWVLEKFPGRVLRLDPQADRGVLRVTVIAGGAPRTTAAPVLFNGQVASEVILDGIAAFTVAPDDSVYLASTDNHVIHRVAPNGRITTIAGKGIPPTSSPETASSALDASSVYLDSPTSLGMLGQNVVALVVPQPGTTRILLLSPQTNGTFALSPVAGNGDSGPINLSVTALESPLGASKNLATGDDGWIYFTQPAQPVGGRSLFRTKGGQIEAVNVDSPHVFESVSSVRKGNLIATTQLRTIEEISLSSGKVNRFMENESADTCAGGVWETTSEGAAAADAWKASLNRVCRGNVMSLSLEDLCASDGVFRIIVSQAFDGYSAHGQLLQVNRSCK